MTSKELKEKYGIVARKMRAIVEKAESEDRSLNESERNEWQGMSAELDALKTRIGDIEEAEAVGNLYDAGEARDEHERALREDRKRSEREIEARPLTGIEYSQALRAWALHDKGEASEDDVQCAKRIGLPLGQDMLTLRIDRGVSESGEAFQAPRSIREAEMQAATRRRMRREERAQSVGTASGGGYSVPDEMMGPLEVALLAWGGMRQAARIIPTAGGGDLPIPTTNDTSQKGAILAENTQVSEQDVTFGQLVLNAYKYTSKAIRVSVELLQDSATNLPQFLGEALGTRIGRITNEHFTTGTGTAQPRGVVTAAGNSGVTAAVAGAINYKELLQLKHSVNPAYRNGAIFMMNDFTLRIMKQIEDSQGRPIWMPSLLPGAPETFDGSPYVINQDMASGAAAKAVLYGDFSKYLIREVRDIVLMRLVERYADYHQQGFLAFARYDGDLLDAGTNPIKYLTAA